MKPWTAEGGRGEEDPTNAVEAEGHPFDSSENYAAKAVCSEAPESHTKG